MTAALVINAITVPVADGSANVKVDVIGETVRAVDAGLVRDWRATKLTWALEMVLATAADADAFRDLILGRHDVWSLEGLSGASSLYSAKGYVLTLAGSSALSNAQAKFGVWSVQVPSASSFQLQNLSYDYNTLPWSVAWWQREASTWHHYVQRSDGQGWKDGVGASVTYWSTTSFTLTFLQSSFSPAYVDDVTVFPFLVPTTWPAFLNAATLAWPSSPQLRAEGLLIANNVTGGKTVMGEIDQETYVQAYLVAGALSPNATKLGFHLIEV